MSLSLIIVCILIFIILIIAPLVVSKKSENNSNFTTEWNKIKDYGKKINDKTRNRK